MREIASREEIYYADEIHRFGVCTYPERRLRIIKNIKNWKKYLPERESEFHEIQIHMVSYSHAAVMRCGNFSWVFFHSTTYACTAQRVWESLSAFGELQTVFPENFAGCKSRRAWKNRKNRYGEIWILLFVIIALLEGFHCAISSDRCEMSEIFQGQTKREGIVLAVGKWWI